MGFAFPGDAVMLLGETRDELSGSSWADAISTIIWVGCRRCPTSPPGILAEVMIEAARRGCFPRRTTCPTVAWLQGLVEASLRNDLGVSLTLPGRSDDVAVLRIPSPCAGVVVGEHYSAFAQLLRRQERTAHTAR